MSPKFLQSTIFAAVTILGGIAQAYIPEGFWTNGWETFYVNSQYEYCQSAHKPEARRLSWSQENELRQYSFQGECESYTKGPKNYRGTSYYFNGEGAYCQYRYYRSNAPEMSWQQADTNFRTNRFDGYCAE